MRRLNQASFSRVLLLEGNPQGIALPGRRMYELPTHPGRRSVSPLPALFHRADANGDGRFDISDPIKLFG